MIKEFTVNIPDELWVDSWDLENTKNYTYDGPRYIKVSVTADMYINECTYGDGDNTIPLLDDSELKSKNIAFEILVDANDHPEIAYMLLTDNESEWEYTYEDEENYDGTIYKKITNPKLRDYYLLERNGLEMTLVPLYKQEDYNNVLLKAANERLDLLNKYTSNYEFSDEDTASINNVINSLNTFKSTVENLRPWKFVTLNLNTVPKIPMDLQLLFNQLPVGE